MQGREEESECCWTEAEEEKGKLRGKVGERGETV